MKFLLACGGSGGHINPALAVADLLRNDGHDILFAGAPHGLESQLVTREGFPIKYVDIRSLSHSLSPKAIVHNVGVVVKMAGAMRTARKIVRDFSPDAALGTGGYASYPPLRAAAQMGVPMLVHESNAIPGITTKMLAKHAKKILVGMASCKDGYPEEDKVEVVGTPVKSEFFNVGRLQARENLRLDNRPFVVSFFGSQGARDMNTLILALMEQLKGTAAWQHTHVTGARAYQSIEARAKELGLIGIPGLRIEEYLYNMPDFMAAADLIICRAGASTLAELAAAGCPSVLIPSIHVANDHQTANAKAFSAAGGALMKTEGELDAKGLYELVDQLTRHKTQLNEMRDTLKKSAVPNSAERIQQLLYSAARA